MEVAVIEAQRQGYSLGQVTERTLTVGELIAELQQQFDEDTPIVISNDGGYTYGAIKSRDIHYGETGEYGDEN